MKVDKGSAVTILVDVEKYTPRTGYAAFNPTTITIAIENDQGTTVMAATAMTNDGSTGQYSHTVQTMTTWATGEHHAIITIDDTVDDVTKVKNVFECI